MHHILRTFIPANAFESRTNDLLDYCRRTGCREVLLFTTSYDEAPSFAPIADIRDYVEQLRPYVAKLKKTGITVDINVMQTLGHVYFPLGMSEEFPFQRRVTNAGKVSTAGACPRCAKLQDWVAETYAIYASLEPSVILVDDDFRTPMDGLTCLCDDHLADISRRAGRAVTREEVDAAIHDSQWPASSLRAHYFDSTTEGYCRLATRIRESVKAASPQTRLGVMAAYFPLGVIGLDYPAVLRALCGVQTPVLRPQMTMYYERDPRELPSSFSNPALFRAALPEKIEYWPEIENYPFTTWSKSTQCTFAQMSAAVLQGFDHLALDLFDFFDHPYADSEAVIAMLEAKRPYFDALRALVPEDSRPLGIAPYVHIDEMRVRRVPTGSWDLCGSQKFSRVLPNLGLPVGAGGGGPWLFITGDDVLAADDAEIDRMLAAGAVIDRTGLESLHLRGFGERVGVGVGDFIDGDELGYEEFVEPTTSPRLHGQRFPLRALGCAGDVVELKPLSGSALPASLIRNYRREAVAPMVLLNENSAGERFAVLAWSGRVGNHQVNENLMRAEQFRELFTWTARRPLPVAVDERTPFVWPILNRSPDGRLVLGLVNCSTDTYRSLTLVMGAEPSELFQLDDNGILEPLPFDVVDSRPGRVRVRFPCDAAPLSMTTLVYR
jgi:hypothetical protein